MIQLDSLDRKAENVLPTPQEIELRNYIKAKLTKMLREEEIYWFQHLKENKILTTPFNEKEIREPLFQMEYNKAPGPDGFPAEFYQFFWDVVKPDVLSLFEEFHKVLPICSLNLG